LAIALFLISAIVRLIVLQNLKNRSADQIYLAINKLSKDIITATFEREKLFSGNVDAQKIKKIADN